MAFREVRVFEVREVLRLWLAGEGIRAMERWSASTARPFGATWMSPWAWGWSATAATIS